MWMINVLEAFDDEVLDFLVEELLVEQEFLEGFYGAISKRLTGDKRVSCAVADVESAVVGEGLGEEVFHSVAVILWNSEGEDSLLDLEVGCFDLFYFRYGLEVDAASYLRFNEGGEGLSDFISLGEVWMGEIKPASFCCAYCFDRCWPDEVCITF